MEGMTEASYRLSFKLLVYFSEQFLFFYADFNPSFILFVKTNRGRSGLCDGDQAQVDMEANHQEQEEVEAQLEDARGGQSPPQRLTRSMFKALGARGRLFSLFVISLVEGA